MNTSCDLAAADRPRRPPSSASSAAALAMVTVGASMFFAEISGSAVADVAATRPDPDPGDEEARLSEPEFAAADHLIVGLSSRSSSRPRSR